MNDREKEIEEFRARQEREARERSERQEQKLRDEEAARRARSSKRRERFTPDELAKLDRMEHSQVIEHLRSRDEHPDVAAARDRVRSRAEAERLIDRFMAARVRLAEAWHRDAEAHRQLREALALVVAAVAVPAEAAHFSDASVSVRDKRGDGKRDLDLVSVSVARRGGTLSTAFVLATPVTNNAIYSLMLTSNGRQVQLAAKRAARRDSFFVFRYSDLRNVYVSGSIKGRVVRVSASLGVVRIANNSFRFSATAEPTNGRRGNSDRAPDGLRSVAFPRR